MTYLGYTLLALTGLGFGLACLYARWEARRDSGHEDYCRGYDACSRVRDREESQRRKEELLRKGEWS